MGNRIIFGILVSLFIFGLLTISLGENAVPKTGDGTKVEDGPATDTSKTGSKTDDNVVQREEQAIKLEGLSAGEVKQLRERAEKHHFQAEVDRMMKLIINSLYKNKDIYLRELISNASDALDKIRFLSLTDKTSMAATEELTIRIKADKESKSLHITDTGIGMTKQDLLQNLGTIAKSGTSDFLGKMGSAKSQTEMSDLIGQFGVGFYSAFLVADRVTVISKHNSDEQYIWESDASSFTIVQDPRGNTLKRGTEVILHLKEEAHNFLEPTNLENLVNKYSQFINFPIHVWSSSTQMVDEEPSVADKKEADKKPETDKKEDATVEEEKEKPAAPKQVEKTIWDWKLINGNKPIWTRKPADVKDDEYNSFYKSFSKESDNPLAKTHFTAEGEVTFKSILFVPKHAPGDMLNNYGKKTDNIKMYVRRVFITDDFKEMMPSYLSFVTGVVDSDDLPLNVSRETLQQHKLLKVIKKKLVRKTLDMIKKLGKAEFKDLYKEYSTNIKLGVMEDHANRTRLAKLLRFWSSHDDKEQVSLAEYVERMKEKQDAIFFMTGSSKEEVRKSPFVESLLKKGFEVLYLVEPIDQYCMQSLPEYEGKKFQNVAKEGLKIDDSAQAKERREAIDKNFDATVKYLKEDGLKDLIEKAQMSERLTDSPCALVALSYGRDASLEQIERSQAHQKTPDAEDRISEKKIFELNPHHPLIKELKKRVENAKSDPSTKELAVMLFETATLRSGFTLPDTAAFAQRIERMLRTNVNVPLDEKVEEEPIDVLTKESKSVKDDKTTNIDPAAAKHKEEVKKEEQPSSATPISSKKIEL